TRTGGVWSQFGPKLDAASGNFGTYAVEQGASVAISGDGQTIIMGQPGANNFGGSAAVFINQPTPPATRLAFYPLPPCRVVDTRLPGSGGRLAAGSTRTINIPGLCGVLTSAQAYSFNITVVPPAPLSFLTIWPAGQSQPNVS